MKNIIIKLLAVCSLFIAPCGFCRFISRLRNHIISKRFCFLSRNFSSNVYIEYPFYIVGYKNIHCGNFSSRAGLRLECIEQYGNKAFQPNLLIGDNVSFNFRCHVGVIDKVMIGNNVLVGSNVLITDHNHGRNNLSDVEFAPYIRELHSKGPVIIEDNVWIGENVSILSNVRVGRNSIIGANSVVIKDVPAYSVVAGNPAKVVKCIKNNSLDNLVDNHLYYRGI